MTRHDQQLLDRQLSHLQIPQRHDGVLMLAMTALFLAGLFLGNWRATSEAKFSQVHEAEVAALSATSQGATLVR